MNQESKKTMDLSQIEDITHTVRLKLQFVARAIGEIYGSDNSYTPEYSAGAEMILDDICQSLKKIEHRK